MGGKYIDEQSLGWSSLTTREEPTSHCQLHPQPSTDQPKASQAQGTPTHNPRQRESSGRGLGGTHHTNHKPHTTHHQVLVHHQKLRGKSSAPSLTHSNIVTVARAEEQTTSPQASQLTSTARGTSSRSHFSASLSHEDCQRLAPWCQPGMPASHFSHTTNGHAGTSLIRLSHTHINYIHLSHELLDKNTISRHSKQHRSTIACSLDFYQPLEAASRSQTSQERASHTTATPAHLCPLRSAHLSTHQRTAQSNDA